MCPSQGSFYAVDPFKRTLRPHARFGRMTQRPGSGSSCFGLPGTSPRRRECAASPRAFWGEDLRFTAVLQASAAGGGAIENSAGSSANRSRSCVWFRPHPWCGRRRRLLLAGRARLPTAHGRGFYGRPGLMIDGRPGTRGMGVGTGTLGTGAAVEASAAAGASGVVSVSSSRARRAARR